MFKLAKKDLILALADKRGLLLGFALPIALITLFAFAFGGVGRDKSAPKPRKVVVVDEDHSTFSKNLVSGLDSLPEFEVRSTTRDTAKQWIQKGDQSAALIILHGAADSMKQFRIPQFEFLFDEGEGPSVAILQGALYGNIMKLIFPGKKNEEEKPSFFKAVPVVQEKENSPGLIHAVAGTAIMMLLFSVAAIGASMLEEKSEGTLKRLMYAPLHPNHILFGKMIYANVIAIAQLLVMFLFAWLVFGLDLIPNLPQTLIMIVGTAYACSSFGVFLASIARTRAQVQGLSTLIILVMSAIGGSMIPTFVMPEFMQKMSGFSVNYWGIQGFYDIFWRALPISDPVFLQRIAVLLLIGTALNTIALVFFKRNIIKLN